MANANETPTEISFTPPIDYNRGVTIRVHPDGFDVNMYQDSPGTFYDVNGKALSTTIALEAGFDVKTLQTLKEKKDRIAKARDDIEREYGEPVDEVVASSGGFTAVSLGNGLYAILDEDGTRLVDEPMDREEAIKLVNKLAPPAPKAATLEDFDTAPEPQEPINEGQPREPTPEIVSREYTE